MSDSALRRTPASLPGRVDEFHQLFALPANDCDDVSHRTAPAVVGGQRGIDLGERRDFARAASDLTPQIALSHVSGKGIVRRLRQRLFRKAGDLEKHIRFLFMLAQRQEVVDTRRAIETCREALTLLDAHAQELSVTSRAEAQYVGACVLFRCSDDWSAIKKHARAGYDLFGQWIGYEIRAAWCAGLLATAHEELGEGEEAAKFLEEKRQRLERFGGAGDSIAVLAKQVLDGTAQEDDLRHLEALAVAADDPRIFLGWHATLAFHLHQNGRYVEAARLCGYAREKVAEQEVRKRHLEEDLALLCHQEAECRLVSREADEYIACMSKAVALAPADLNRRWLLCQNAFVFGRFAVSLEQARHLIEKDFGVGAYRIASRCELAIGNPVAALQTAEAARAKYASHPLLAGEYDELTQIRLGLLTTEEARLVTLPRSVSPMERAVQVETQGLPEYRELDGFRRAVIDSVVTYIHDIQKTSPRVLRDYQTGTGEVEEADFRDDLERICGQKWRELGAETRHGAGRVDLIVRAQAPSLDAVINEFKIWGRNDYKDVVAQLLGYLTDFQAVGVVFMINLNKNSIAKKYVDTIVFGHPSYVIGTFREKPVTSSRLDHYYSRHRSQMGKEIQVFHFVFDVWERKEAKLKATRNGIS